MPLKMLNLWSKLSRWHLSSKQWGTGPWRGTGGHWWRPSPSRASLATLILKDDIEIVDSALSSAKV